LFRYIYSGDAYLTVRGRGACSSFPDMPVINCKTQPKLTNIENCPTKCSGGCKNGFCDCATGECMCNPGFYGTSCAKDTCLAAKCLNGNCAALYLGGDLLVTKNPCACKEGWYGPKCDSTIKPADLVLEPVCLSGSYFYLDHDIQGGNLALVSNAPNPKECAKACLANPACNSWVSAGGGCYLKTGTQRFKAKGPTSGIKCSAITDNTGQTTNLPVITTANLSTKTSTVSTSTITTTSSSFDSTCQSRCNSPYPHGCNPSFNLGYCNLGGGCFYSPVPENDPNWCCFKGCNSSSTVTTLSQLIDRHEWGCDFLGGDFLNAPAPLWQNCLYVCKDREGCTHFAWMNGTCYMKKGGKTMKDKISNTVTACGCINC
jgi:hypothetical protein